MDPRLQALYAERDSLLTRMAAPGEGDNIDELVTRADELVTEIEAHLASVARAAEARSRLAGTQVPAQRADARGPLGGTPAGTPPAGGAGGDGAGDEGDLPVIDARTVARAFVRSQGFAEFRARGHNGSVVIEVPGDTRALVTTATGPAPQATRVPGMIAPPDRPTRILDLIDRRPTTTDSIEYVQETLADANAGFVAEGQVKPEASFGAELKTATASTVATWVNITRQAAENDSLLMGYIEGRMTNGIGRTLERDVLAGTGAAPRLRGILATPGRGLYAAPAGEAAVLSIRKAKTVAALSEYFPDTVALNPIDWERIELSTDNNGAFRVTTSAQGVITARVWGLTVVETTAVTGSAPDPDGAGAGVASGGKFLVGGFREGATLWERTGIKVYLTDSHASNFTSNILTLLAEMRALLTVWRPAAFVDGTFAPGTN